VNQRIATRYRHGDEVGLELHLSGERALSQHDGAEQQIDERADRPHDQSQQPADPRDTDVPAG
jgi:hypothetical protein